MKPLLFALLAFASCTSNSGEKSMEYEPPNGSFRARLPVDWKVDDSPDARSQAVFYGPPSAPGTFAQMIRVSLVVDSSPDSYRASRPGLPSPLAETFVSGEKSWEFLTARAFIDPHSGTSKIYSRVVMLPTARGLFVFEHTWQAGTAPRKAVFDELLRSFKAPPIRNQSSPS